MKSAIILTGVAAFATQVASHATFQQLWVNGVDQISTPKCLVSTADIHPPVDVRKITQWQQPRHLSSKQRHPLQRQPRSSNLEMQRSCWRYRHRRDAPAERRPLMR